MTLEEFEFRVENASSTVLERLQTLALLSPPEREGEIVAIREAMEGLSQIIEEFVRSWRAGNPF